MFKLHLIRVHIQVSPGDTVQVNPPPEWNGDLRGGKPCVIDGSNRGNVIVSPDMLITPTAIATSVTCPRKYVCLQPLLIRVCRK